MGLNDLSLTTTFPTEEEVVQGNNCAEDGTHLQNDVFDYMTDMSAKEERNSGVSSLKNASFDKMKPWQKAIQRLKQMKRDGMTLETAVYSKTISLCEKAHKWEKAWDLFMEMREQGLEADALSYNAIIIACGKGNKKQMVLTLFSEMQEKGVKANVTSYNVILNVHGRHRSGRRPWVCLVK